jgi:p-cumate 2,3-dioxygenase alpha subunit
VFETSGKLANVPVDSAMYPGYADDDLLNMRAVPRCEEYRGFIFVSYDRNIEPLADYLGGAKEYLSLIADQGEEGMEVVQGAEEYCIPSNWKFMQENSVDGYHAMATHSTYIEYTVARDGPKPHFNPTVDYGTVTQLGNGHAVSWSVGSTPWGRPYARWTPAWGDEAKQEIEAIEQRIIERVGPERGRLICHSDRNMTIFPNLAVHDIMGITIRNLLPKSAGDHDINAWSLAPVNESDSSRERRMRNYVEFLGPAGFATPDDTEMLELCQQGAESSDGDVWNDVSRGMLKPRDKLTKLDEAQQRTFWRRWRQLMTNSDPAEVVGP